MENKDLWKLVEDLYFNYETESVLVNLTDDGGVEILVKTFLRRE